MITPNAEITPKLKEVWNQAIDSASKHIGSNCVRRMFRVK